ncbi:alcohol dehydrogenase catalytic domain-containing protein [candidate division KSB1 bacterium]|nr:alcohol dehydrogenase catalytic domain-containing protein [candidate division KSB1 bacterium]
MKTIFLTELQKLELGKSPKPEIKKPQDLLIKMKSVGICGSDVHYFEWGRIGRMVVKFPYVVGHECAGIVEDVGKGVTRFKPGDRVVVDPAIFCGKCNQCKAGRFHTCYELEFLGTPASDTSKGLDGCMKEYIVHPARSVYHLPDEMTYEDGALLEPLTIGYYSIQKGEMKPGKSVAILGSGPIGLSVLTCLRFWKPGQVFATDLIPERVQVSREMGADYSFNTSLEDSTAKILDIEKEGVDFVFECAGEQETIDQGIELLKPGGTLVLIGIPEAGRISGDIDKLRRREIRVQNIRRQNECTQSAIEAIHQNHTNLAPLKTHYFAPEQAQEAFELVKAYRDGVIKAFINWD